MSCFASLLDEVSLTFNKVNGLTSFMTYTIKCMVSGYAIHLPSDALVYSNNYIVYIHIMNVQ